MVINPEKATAEEISRLISFPFAISTTSFAHGLVSIVEMRVAADSVLEGESIAQIHKRYHVNVLICAVEREGRCYIPRGDFVLREDDRIHVSGDQKKIALFLRGLDMRNFKIKKVMIIGGGRISYYLAQMLEDSGVNLCIVEKNPERCQLLSADLDALIIEGDGTDAQLLAEEGLSSTDAFVALTDIDEENMVISLVAAKAGVSKVIVKVNRENYFELIQNIGIDSVVSPKYITANHILRYVRAMQNAGEGIKTLYRIVDDQAEIVEFSADGKTMHLNEELCVIKMRDNTIIGAIVRGGKLIIPHGNDCIMENDAVIIITTHKNFNNINDIFAD
jgi:trk system potassium uptake protein TrkA